MKFEKWLEETTTTANIAQPLAQGAVDVIGAGCPEGYKWSKEKKICVPVSEEAKKEEKKKPTKKFLKSIFGPEVMKDLKKESLDEGLKSPNTAKWKAGKHLGQWHVMNQFGDVRDVDGEAWAYMSKTREFLHLGTTKELKKMKKTSRWLPEGVESSGFYMKIRSAQNRGKAQQLAKQHGVHPSNVGYVYLDYADDSDEFIKQAYERTKRVLQRPKISDVNKERQELILANLERVMKERGIKESKLREAVVLTDPEKLTAQWKKKAKENPDVAHWMHIASTYKKAALKCQEQLKKESIDEGKHPTHKGASSPPSGKIASYHKALMKAKEETMKGDTLNSSGTKSVYFGKGLVTVRAGKSEVILTKQEAEALTRSISRNIGKI